MVGADGLDRPDEGLGDVFPLALAVDSPVFSMALAAAALAPASGFDAAAAAGSFLAASFFASSFAGAVPPMERTFAFGAALAVSPPMLRTLVPPSLVVMGLFRSAVPLPPAVGSVCRLATVGAGFCCCCGCACCCCRGCWGKCCCCC